MTERTSIAYTIFGASGKVGKELLSFFSTTGIPVTAVTRNPAHIRALPAVNWEIADLEDEERVYDLVKESKGIFLATSYSDKMVQLQGHVVAAAARAGIQHIVKLSAKGVVANPDAAASRAHAQVEQLIRDAGIPYTILQPASFIQGRVNLYIKDILEEKKIYEAVGDARIPFIDTRDIAEAAYKVLTAAAEHRNKSYVLTGGVALDYYQLADVFSWALGEEVRYVPLTPEAMRMRMEQEGKAPAMISFYLDWARNQREADATISPWVHEILGKPPRCIAQFVTEYVHTLKQSS